MIKTRAHRYVRSFARPSLLVTFCAAMVGCASVPKEPKTVVEAYRRFLLDTETPFPKRAQKHLGLKAEVDPETLEVGRFIRLGPEPGNAVYATVTLSRIGQKLNLGRMTTRFDSSIACIRRSDLAVLGMAFSGPPIVVHEMRSAHFGIVRFVPTPERIHFSTPRGDIDILLQTFDRDCVATVEHEIEMVPSR